MVASVDETLAGATRGDRADGTGLAAKALFRPARRPDFAARVSDCCTVSVNG